MAGILSPDVRNYQVGKGFLMFQPDGDAAFYHLGNCPKFTYTPNITVLPHMSDMLGEKAQDFSVITQKGGTVSIDMEELTAKNLSLFLLGDIDDDDPDQVEVDIFSKAEQIFGRLQFFATNNVGPRWYFDLFRIMINPTGDFNPISDGYNKMTVNGLHVIDDEGLWGKAILKPPVKNVIPENVLLPFVSGPLKQGMVPAFAKVGEVMVANIGAWVGVTGLSYQWLSAGHPIVGATAKTYKPVIGDVGQALSVQITATNLNGETIKISGPTQAVHP